MYNKCFGTQDMPNYYSSAGGCVGSVGVDYVYLARATHRKRRTPATNVPNPQYSMQAASHPYVSQLGETTIQSSTLTAH